MANILRVHQLYEEKGQDNHFVLTHLNSEVSLNKKVPRTLIRVIKRIAVRHVKDRYVYD